MLKNEEEIKLFLQGKLDTMKKRFENLGDQIDFEGMPADLQAQIKAIRDECLDIDPEITVDTDQIKTDVEKEFRKGMDAEFKRLLHGINRPKQLSFQLSEKMKIKFDLTGYSRHLELIVDEGNARYIGLLSDKTQLKKLYESILIKIIENNSGFECQRDFKLSENMSLVIMAADDDAFEDVKPQIVAIFNFIKDGKEYNFEEWLDDIKQIKNFQATLKSIL